MIYFDIQHHGNNIEHLPNIDLLQDSESILNVSIDTQGEITDQLIDQVYSSRFAKSKISKSAQISWGGISIVEQQLVSMQRALLVPSWQFYVTLSGSCAPLKPINKIREHLLDGLNHSRVLAYLDYFSFKDDMWNFQGISLRNSISERKVGRATLRADAAICELVDSGEFDPVRCVGQRRLFSFQELKKNTYFVDTWSAEDRINYETLSSLSEKVAGRQWVILHREVVEWMVSTGIAREIASLLLRTFVPDETFFQSVLLCHRSPFVKNISRGNLWYRGGGPMRLTLNDIKSATDGPWLFARKFHESTIQNLTGYVKT